jgi:hypothetical protein
MLPVRDQFDPGRRGNHAIYRANERNWCPGCGREHWTVSQPRVIGFSKRPGVGPLE